MLGFLTGAVIFGLTYDSVFPAISAIANYGGVIIPDLCNINAGLAITFFVLFGLLLFYLIDRKGMIRKDKINDNK